MFVLKVSLLVAVISFFTKTSAIQISCEKTGNFLHKFSPYSNRHAIYKTCFMNESTVINSSDFTISSFRDESIARLDFFSNRNIFYLPVNVSESFPKLSFYNAQNCSIKFISNKNFKGMFELKKLYLDNNGIEKICSDTFEDSLVLEWLTLGKIVESVDFGVFN